MEIKILIDILIITAIALAGYFGHRISKGQIKQIIETITEAASDRKLTPQELFEIGRQISLAFGYEIEYTRPPETICTISAASLEEQLKTDLSEIKDLRLADVNYAVTTKEEIMAFLKADLTNQRTYKVDIFDCDDFAATLYGRMKAIAGNLAFGFALVNWKDEKGETVAHAVNIAYLANRVYGFQEQCVPDGIYIIEPQNDSIFKKPDNWAMDLVVI